jgi:type II secretory pathway pseudopilin PulG
MLRATRKLHARLAARLGDLRDERGSILLEALASAVLLALLTLAVLEAVDGASASSGRNKARSVAAQLAEQDQERMRGMRFIDLSNYNASNPVPVDGVTYTVASRADWIRDATGGTESCTNDSTQSNYLRIRSTVTSNVVGSQTAPVVIDSLVAPPVDTFGPDQGTLAVKLVDRDGNTLPGKNVTISGGPRTLSDVTNGAGCAIFAFIPKGDYDITLPAPGWVTDKPIPAGKVIAGQVNVVAINYDQAATVTGSFYTQLPTDTAPTTKVVGWKLSGDNAGLGGTPKTTIATPAAGAAQVTASDLYPFKTAYSFYSGDCQGPLDTEFNVPTKKNPTYYSTHQGLKALNPGEVVGSMTIVQPAVTLKVLNGGSIPPTATVVATSTSAQCTTPFPMTIGPLDGLIRKPASVTSAYDPSLPFGHYTITVTAAGKTKTVTVNNTNPGGAVCTQMDVSAAGPSGGATCP